MDIRQNNLINIAGIVDYYCNTRIYIDLLHEEALKMIKKYPYCWIPVENTFTDSMLESKKYEILYAIEIRFGIQLSDGQKKLLIENSFCTFKDLESIVHTVKTGQKCLK